MRGQLASLLSAGAFGLLNLLPHLWNLGLGLNPFLILGGSLLRLAHVMLQLLGLSVELTAAMDDGGRLPGPLAERAGVGRGGGVPV